jgi:hypothetical protein
MDTETPQLAISRVFDAPPELVYRAFTEPDHLSAWWGPIGNSLPRDEIEFDVRPGGCGSPNTWRPPARRVGSRRSPSWTPRWQVPRLLRPIIEV